MVQLIIGKSSYLNQNQKRFLTDIFAELRKIFEDCMSDIPTKSYTEMVNDLVDIADKIETSNVISVKLEKWHSFYEKKMVGYISVFSLCNALGVMSMPTGFKVSSKGVSYENDKIESPINAMRELILGGITQIIGQLMIYIYSKIETMKRQKMIKN